MNYVSRNEYAILGYVAAHPNCNINEICVGLGKKPNGYGTKVLNLHLRGLLARTGKRREYRYSRTEIPCEIRRKPQVQQPWSRSNKASPEYESIKLTSKQEAILSANLHLPRRQLATMVGIEKIELNLYMEKHGIQSKYKPIREE